MDNWFGKVTQWYHDIWASIFGFLVDWIHDAAVWVFDGVVSALAGLIASVPVPSFMSSGVNIGTIFSGFPPFALYLISHMGLANCFAVVGAGVAFRLVRKIVTLGQW
ncbi:MAG: hypothetical protein EG826_15600 [Deltaproteobacteria bacterium]|nr:hypothetical protein [Deltaproteobacteria bacterium]